LKSTPSSDTHLTFDELEAGLDEVRRAPGDGGVLEMIVRRPGVGERETLEEAALSTEAGLVGDSWSTRKDPDPAAQLTIMSSRLIALVAGDRGRWPLAGDQLFVDLDLSVANLPAGTRLAIGSAVIEISEEPHTGCRKFLSRYGVDAQKFVNSRAGRELRLRGVNARVVRAGTIRRGDRVAKTG
jgi:MOSC domain-containing protein YiiM